VGVIVDGELVFASEEERWTRHKHSPDEPPINALKHAFLFLKEKYGIRPKDIDAYAVNWDPKLMTLALRQYFASLSFENSVNNHVKLDLFQGGLINKGVLVL